MTKTRSEKRHFYNRCLQRFGTTFNRRQMINLLHEGKLEFLERQSNRITVWKKDDAVFVYDKNRKTFVTAMTYDMWKTDK